MIRLLSCMTLALSACVNAEPKGVPQSEPVAIAQAAAGALGSELKRELMAAMQASGPVAAIEVCRSRAADITAERARQSGLQISRTALRYRNPDNAPDDWERTQMETFEQRLTNGETAASISAHHREVTAQGIRHRVLLPIITQPPCLTCHGSALPETVKSTLSESYPDDRATGFVVGELRGAYSVRWTTSDTP